MIQRTFQLIRGVGPYRERDLWARGVPDWDGFEARAAREVVMSSGLDRDLLAAVGAARQALARGDLLALAGRLPAREHWRLYGAFPGEALFLDIEADGDGVPTVVGLFDRDGVATFLDGDDEGPLLERLASRPLWVSFNGGAFDLPALARRFPALVMPPVHVDLRFLVRRARLAGGLKAIEDAIGAARPEHLRGMAGLEAIRLWRAWREERALPALRLLVEYNLYDAVNLRAVLEWCCRRIPELWGWESPASPRFERGDVLYDISRLVLGLPDRRTAP